MAGLRIVGLALLASVGYGVAHDQVTALICVEYFTIGHPPLFPTQSPALLALGWGVIATWWVGLPFGLLLAAAARLGPRPKLTAADLRRPVAIGLLVIALTAVLAGIAGGILAERGQVWLVPPLSTRVPPDRHARFIVALWAHLASYGAGILGGFILSGWAWRSRGKPRLSSLKCHGPTLKTAAGILAVAGCSLPFLGCTHEEDPKDASVSPPAPGVQAPVEKPVDALDAEVLTTVLVDLLTYPGDDSPLAIKGSLPEEILFDPTIYRQPQTDDDVLYCYPDGFLLKMTEAQYKAAREAVEELVRRIQDRESPGEFKTQDGRIRIHRQEAAEGWTRSIRSVFDRPVRAWPPGYSRDKRHAIVRLSIPWSMHGAEATYLLAEAGGKWTVCLRQFQIYL